METANWWVQLIGVVLGGGMVSAIVGAIATRKKIGADAESTFVATSNDQRRSLVEDADRFRGERDLEHVRANRLEGDIRNWWARADRMMIWVRRQEARNEEAGVVDPAPTLYPPEDE